MPVELCEKIYICKEMNFNHIEIGIDSKEDFNLVYENLHKIKEQNISIGIHLPLEINTCENIQDIQNSWISFIMDLHEWKKVLDVKYYNMHLGYGFKNKVLNNKKKYLNNSIIFFKRLLNLIDNTDIYIENVYSKLGEIISIGNCYEDFKYLFENINDDRFRFCYDTGHDLINPSDYLLLSNYTKLIHVSDNNGKEDLHLGLGKGIFPLEKLSKLFSLESLEYIILEMDKKYFESTKKIINKTLLKKKN